MPKNKKPQGGRPAKNFDPSYAKGGSKGGPARAGSSKPGSRSEGHRGYRPEADEPRKERWSRDERVATGRAPHRSERDGRDERGPRSYDRNDRPARSYDRDDRAPRSNDRNDRPARSYDRDDRAPRSNDRNDRAPRSFDRNDSAPRSFDRNDRNDRPARSFDRDDRAPRSNDRNDRAPRSFDRNDRNDRPARSFDRNDRNDRNDRPARSFDRDDRAPRSNDRNDRAPRSFDRNDRNDRPARSFDRNDRNDRNDRPARSFDRDDRAPRSFDRNDRPARSFDRNDRPARSFDRNDRPARSFDRNDRPARSFDRPDRPARSYDRDDRAPRRDVDRPGFKESGRRDSSFYPAKEQGNRFAPNDDVVLERLEAQAIQATDADGVSFADLGLGGNVVSALKQLGAESPFPIQAATIPVVLEGRDVLGRGKTGSGKTIAFGAPTVERLMKLWAESGKAGGKRQMGRKPRALILAPTRELALQIDRTVQPIAQSVGLFTTQIYGGVPQQRQVGALQRGVDIVIGTPGRIEDLIEQRRLDLSEVVITVLDEADHMCDLGFLEPVQRIIRHTANGGQKLLFSATLDKGVAALVDEFLVDPAVHEVAGEDQASSTIEHRVFVIGNHEKRDIVAELANREGKTLVFSRTRAFAEDLTEHLEDYGIRAVALHGDLNQSRRTRNLQQLTSGRVNVLVATDVAARGIHVDDIDLVIQADAPDEYKTYLHRSGRTGRAGKTGQVVTLIPRNRQRRMVELLDRAEIDVDFVDMRLGDDFAGELERGAAAVEADAAVETLDAVEAIIEIDDVVEIIEVEEAIEIVETESAAADEELAG
ncbi:DEAD/DEAH box helicase [Agromyces cerinus]|uniref:Superfamily II DNA and RNA helicase n=1 Tax=Agromyces cerinus subsp. cerinus TaxID=232089 RepID=A0A1N6EXB0_9MICO|nr:DEAD/DEAH box helicase [Agromyces cerinus]SIN87640.1 Superfamily II DNA and RNA helicase [Agromyces cerinus subsp. cerinus]